MADINAMKSFFKEADNSEALKGFEWATTAMEVRGLIQIPGARKRRSDAGGTRGDAKPPADATPTPPAQPTIEAVRERLGHDPIIGEGIARRLNGHDQNSLTGFPDEDQEQEKR